MSAIHAPRFALAFLALPVGDPACYNLKPIPTAPADFTPAIEAA